MKINNFKKNKTIYILAAIIILILLFDMLNINFTDNSTINSFLKDIILRVVSGVIFLYIINSFNIKILNPLKKPFLKSLLIILPPFIVALNNLPALALINGDAYINADMGIIVLFAAVCIMVGLFEETLFRGLLLPYVLKGAKASKSGIMYAVIISSLIFGAFHILNIFFGAGVGNAVFQAGYSFLIGAMLAVMLLKTKNIWLCVIIHAVYNFCGLIVPRFGGGVIWDMPTIIITAVIGVAVAFYVLKIALSLDPEQTKDYFDMT